jgi:NAD(P)H-nitrite reductase large subunit
MAVERCICENRSFVEIRDEALRRGLSTVDELKEARLCGTGCEMCLPYVERMLHTGETSFDPLPLRSR